MTKLDQRLPILAIIGPSGVGKTTIVNQLVEIGLLAITPTWTDRPKRPLETTLEHHFVSSSEFDRLVASNFFAHPPLQLFGLPHRYALPYIQTPDAGQTPAILIRIAALDLLNKLYPARIIYQIEAPRSVVEARLIERTKDGAPLGTRLTDYNTEIKQGRSHADRIFINDGDLRNVVGDIITALQQDFGVADKDKLPYTQA